MSKYTAAMQRIRYEGGYNHYFLLESGAIEFAIENIRIEFSDLTEQEIEKMCREKEDGTLEYNVTNDIYVPIQMSELVQHITNTKKRLEIIVDVKMHISKEKVGAGIVITR